MITHWKYNTVKVFLGREKLGIMKGSPQAWFWMIRFGKYGTLRSYYWDKFQKRGAAEHDAEEFCARHLGVNIEWADLEDEQ